MCFFSTTLIVIIICLFLVSPTSTSLEGGIVAFRGQQARVKRQADNSDLVVKQSFSMKKNKQITGFTEEEKRNMVHLHNAYRSLVRPLAANMLEVSWDDEIATFAQDWADECTATHRPNRDLSPWINMGENLYWWYSGSYNEALAVKWWWDEVLYYDIMNNSCVPGEVCGHYITEVWAKTEKIGCGVNRCSRLWDLPDYGRGAYYFVCSYSGRFLSNAKPYIATDYPCSSCHRTKFPRCRYNLCVTQEMIDKDIGYNGSTEITGLDRTVTRSHPKTVTVPTTAEATTTSTTTTTIVTSPTTQEVTTPTTITTITIPLTTTTTDTSTTTPTTTTTTPTTTTTTPSTTTTTTTSITTTTTPPTTTTTTPTTTTTTPSTTTTTPSTTTISLTTTTTPPPKTTPTTATTTTTPKTMPPTTKDITSPVTFPDTSTGPNSIETTIVTSLSPQSTSSKEPATTKKPIIHVNGPFNAKVLHSFSLPLILTSFFSYLIVM